MSKKRSKPPAAGKDDAPDSDRPTVTPPFDPEAFAKEVMRKGSPSSQHTHATPPASIALGRERLPTLTDPFELEDARKRSAQSSPPNRASGPLALVNMNAPSLAPEPLAAAEPKTRPAPAMDEDWSELDRAWADDPTRKPPSKIPKAKSASAAPRAPTPAKGHKKEKKKEKPKPDDDADSAFARALGASEPPRAPEAVGEPEPFSETHDGTLAPHTIGEPEPFSSASASKRAVSPGSELAEMRDRFSLGDYTGALEIAERILGTDADNEEVKECAQNCRTTLEQMYTARIGPLDRVPVVMVPREQLRWLSIDHRAGFVLSLIDGVSSVEMILDVSGMPALDALRILCELAQQRIISFR